METEQHFCMGTLIVLIWKYTLRTFFADTKEYVNEWFDAYGMMKITQQVRECGFPVGVNHKKAGLMADDCLNDFITEFWGTASKEYCYKTEKRKKEEIKAKGIGKKTREQALTFEDYQNATFNNQTKLPVEQAQIRSFNLKNYTIKLDKKIFTGDQKRILVDNINTLANGHWKDVGVSVLPEGFPLPKKGTLARMCLELLREEYRKKLSFLPL